MARYRPASCEGVEFRQQIRTHPRASVPALTDLCKQGIKADYIYIDGAHTFDYALVDFFCSDRVLNVGGILIFDDMWRRTIQKVATFIRANISGYEELPTAVNNVFCVKKTKEDDRAWDHFAAF